METDELIPKSILKKNIRLAKKFKRKNLLDSKRIIML